jgi:site-specific recombinase XerD
LSPLKTQDQGLTILPQLDYLPIIVESFLIDCKAQGLSPDTIELYTKKLKYFLRYCERQALTQISQITSDFIHWYLLELSETHKPGGGHVGFDASRTMLYWIEEEIMPDSWKNPIRRVKSPKLPIDPIEPIQIEEIRQLLKTSKTNYSGPGKGTQATHCIPGAQNDSGDSKISSVSARQLSSSVGFHSRITYIVLCSILRRRAEQIGMKSIPTPHDFRRAFELMMLHNGVVSLPCKN